MLAAFVLGAEGVQIGSRFVASNESSAHPDFKAAVVDAQDGNTQMTLRELTPVRLLKNKFYNDLMALYKTNPSKSKLQTFLGRARAKRGMFEGDLEDGELEIGQISALIDSVLPVADIVKNIVNEYKLAVKEINYKSLNK